MKHRNQSIAMLKTFAAIVLCLMVGIPGLYGEEKNGGSSKDGSLNIYFNFLSGELTAKKGGEEVERFIVKKGRHIIFRVININTFNYDVVIDGKLLNHNTDIPDLFKSLGKKEEGKKTEPENDKEGKLKQSFAKITNEEKYAAVKDLIARLTKIKEMRKGLESLLFEAVSFTQLNYRKKKLLEGVKELVGEAHTPGEIETKLNEVVKEAKMLLKSIKDLSSKENIEKMKISKDEIDEYVKDKANKKTLPTYFETLSKYFQGVAVDFQVMLENAKKVSQLENLLKEFEEKGYIAEIKQLIEKFRKENFEVSLTIPTVDADDVIFKVEIKPAEGKKVKVHNQLAEPVKVEVKGGWKVDSSTGVFFHLNAHDRTYWFDEKEDGKGLLKYKKDIGSIQPMVGALLHIYPRRAKLFSKRIYWSGIAFGLGTGDAEKLSYYLGTGVILGSKRRFLLNCGVTFVKTEILLPRYRDSLNTDIKIEIPADDVPLTEPVYKMRLFFSLTYNLN
jgi:hypothetical protein